MGAYLMLPLFVLPLLGHYVGNGAINLGTCAVKIMAGLPCLTCGSTRATMLLFDGHILDAISFQPMMMFIYVLVAFWGSISLWAFLRRKRVRIKLTDREDFVLKALLVGIPISNWFYLVSAGI